MYPKSFSDFRFTYKTKFKIISFLLLIFLLFFTLNLINKKQKGFKSKASTLTQVEDEIVPKKLIETKIISLQSNKNNVTRIKFDQAPIEINIPAKVLNENIQNNFDLRSTLFSNIDDTNLAILNLELLLKNKNLSDQSILNKETISSELFSPQAKATKQNFFILEFNLDSLEEEYALSTIRFTYYNPSTKKWENLPSEIDRENNILRTKVSHLSQFGVSGQKAQVFSPTLKNWETSLYTGSVSYNYPIDVVPGKGGLNPNLSLSYNSNRANSLSAQQKGSWVGAGWDLTLPEIRFEGWTEKPGTNNQCGSYTGTKKRGPQYSLILWGVEEPLYYVGELKENNQFLASKYISKGGIPVLGYYGNYRGNTHFQFSNCDNQESGRGRIITRFVAQGKDGKEYIFDANQNNSVADRLIKNTLAPSRYMVSEIKDASGNKMVFEYEKEEEDGHVLAVYPKLIKYNFQGETPMAAVEFETVPKTHQPDNTFSLDQLPTNPKEFNFERRKLVQIKTYSNYPQRTILKTYKIIYDTQTYQYPYKYTASAKNQPRPTCNPDNVIMIVNPQPATVNQEIEFFVGGSEGDTWIEDSFSPNDGVDCQGPIWGKKVCRALKEGTFQWTHKWKKCFGDFNNCSDVCQKTIPFTISSSAVANPTTIPIPTLTPAPPSFPGWSQTGYDVLTKIEVYQGEENPKNKFVSETYTYEMRTVGYEHMLVFNSSSHSGWYQSCEQPLSLRNFSWNNLADEINNLQGQICPWQREKLYQRGLQFCRGELKLGANGGFNAPDNPQLGCPEFTEALGYFEVQNCTPTWDNQGNFSCPSVVWQGSVLGWAKAKAPFIKKINNGYGGEIVYEWDNIFNKKKEYAINRNVVSVKEERETRYTYLPNEKKPVNVVRTEYIYEKIPLNETTKPERSGGFQRVTLKDPTTGMLTTNYFYPLAPKIINGEVADWDSLNDPERNPFWGLPLRTVVHREEKDNQGRVTKDHIYSDEFYSYSFIPVYHPTFFDEQDLLFETLVAEGIGNAVKTATYKFTPKNSLFVTLEGDLLDPNRPSYFNYHQDSQSSNPKFIQTQTKTWYDRYGNVVKTASFAQVKGFIDYSNNAELSRRREIIGRWYEKDSQGNYSANSYGLVPMSPLFFEKQGSQIIANNPPSVGEVVEGDSDKIFSFTKYLYQTNDQSFTGGKPITDYLKKNLTSLIIETFSTYVDKSDFEAVDQKDRFNWTTYRYDEEINQVKGLLTSQTIKNTHKPQERLKLKNNQEMPDEITTKTRYDAIGNVVEIIDPKGTKTTTVYYTSGPYAYILPYQVKSEIKDENGNLKLESVSTTTYDPKTWLPLTTTDPNGIVSKVEYDCLGRLQKVYKPDLPERLTNATPEETYLYFDYQGPGCGLGEINTQTPLPHLRVKKKIITPNPNNSSQEEERYLYTDTISDGFGRTIQTKTLKTLVNGQEKSILGYTFFNNRGLKEKDSLPIPQPPVNLTSDTNPAPAYQPYTPSANNPTHFTTYEYNELGQVTKTVDPLGQETKTEYLGLITRTYDANNVSNTSDPTYTETETDGFGRTVKTKIVNIKNNNQTYTLLTENRYAPVLGVVNQTTVFKCNEETCQSRQALFSSRSFFDRIGRRWKSTDPDLGTWYYAYDEVGNLVAQKDAKGQTLYFAYDSSKRLVLKEYPGNPRANLPTSENRNFVRFIYDIDEGKRHIGAVMRMIDPTGETIYNYDKLGRLTSEVKRIDKALIGQQGFEEFTNSFEYYSNGALKSSTLPSGQKFTNYLNPFGQLTKIQTSIPTTTNTSPADNLVVKTLLTNQHYNVFGNPTLSFLGETNNQNQGMVFEQRYDRIGRLNFIRAKKNNENLLEIRYEERDKVGNITKLSRASLNQSAKTFQYTYNSIYQLTGVSGAQNASYQYDPKGNLLRKVEGAETVEMVYDDPSHLHAPKRVNGFTYQYDQNGNLLEDEERKYTWDYDNKPVKIEYKQTGKVIEMAYDGNGNRVIRKEHEGDTTFYFGAYEKTINSQDNVKEEKLFYSLVQTTYQLTKNYQTNQTQEVYIFKDHLDSTSLITDLQGNVLAESIYFAYGKTHEGNLNPITRRQYTSQYKEDDNLYYYNARYYNPKTGRFISADLAEGPNRYAYVGNNPIMANDPSGEFLNIIVGAAIGATVDIGTQIVTNMIQGQSFSEAAKNINWVQVGISAAVGGATSGLSTAATVGRLGGILAKPAARIIASTVIEGAGNALTEVSKAGWDLRKTNWTNVAINTAMGSVANVGADKVGKVLGNVSIKEKVLDKIYDKFGHKQLKTAISLYRSGNYEKVFQECEKICREINPDFLGFRMVEFNDPRLGALSDGSINAKLPLERQASLAIHETSHQITAFSKLHERIFKGRRPTTTEHYGLYAQYVLLDELQAYSAEYVAGGRTFINAVRNLIYSFQWGTGGENIRHLIKNLSAIVLER